MILIYYILTRIYSISVVQKLLTIDIYISRLVDVQSAHRIL